jgi:hypothetical protein
MSRIVLTDGSGRWFDSKKATSWEEDTYWNGNNHISRATGDHEILYRTKGGIHILHRWSQWQGSTESYEEISADDAARWLSQNDHEPSGAGAEAVSAYAALEVS